MIVEVTSFQFFSTLCILPKLSFGQSVPLAFIADFGLRKTVLRAETRFAIIDLAEKLKTVDSCWSKSGFLVSGVLLEVIFGTEKMVKA